MSEESEEVREGGGKVNQDLEDIKKSLAHIESLLQRMPEIQAAVLIQMQEEYGSAKSRGRRADDIWVICPTNQR